MVYLRHLNNEKYIIAINPSAKMVSANINSHNNKHASYVLGTTDKCTYKTGSSKDIIKFPPVSAAIFKLG